MWPQLAYLLLVVLGVGVVLAKHGEPREPYNIWSTLISLGIVLPILWAGGFFAPLGF